MTGFFIPGVFLAVGCFLDAIPSIIIVVTIVQPIAAQAGLDPVHVAMIGNVSPACRLVTPPYGPCLLIACSVGNIGLGAAMRDVVIMLRPMFAMLALVILFPQIALALPWLVSPEFPDRSRPGRTSGGLMT